MNLEEALSEWQSKNRRMGCVAATRFLCDRVPGFYAQRVTRYTQEGDMFSHVVATNGRIVIDLAPYADAPKAAPTG